MTADFQARPELRVEWMSREHSTIAGLIVAEAFQQETLTSQMLDLNKPDVRQRIGRLFGTIILSYLDDRQPVLVAIAGETPVGVLLGKSPDTGNSVMRRLAGYARNWREVIALAPTVRWRNFSFRHAIAAPENLPEPHYAIDVLAVAPEVQGQGIGRLLLRKFHAFADADDRAAGIYLATADERPRGIYQRQGYELFLLAVTDRVTVFHMFRRRPGSSKRAV